MLKITTIMMGRNERSRLGAFFVSVIRSIFLHCV
jgi:hypothetical protein